MNTTFSSSLPSTPATISGRPHVPLDTQLDATARRAPTEGARALVLGGGGSTGNAWLIGVIAGLLDGGCDVTMADLTIGTSAGSTAAAQLAATTPKDLLASVLAEPLPPHSGRIGSGHARPSGRPANDHLEKLRAIIAGSADAADYRCRAGAAALATDSTADEIWQAQWHATVASRLPDQRWPERLLRITAVNARDGQPVLFDRDSGVELVDAVAASCAGGGFAYRIGDDLYIDGGYRANADNADLAAGYERVLVLSPLGGRSLHPQEWGTHLSTQFDQLRAGGSRVETIVPPRDSEHLFGARAMDQSKRPSAARVGYEQAHAQAKQISEFWH